MCGSMEYQEGYDRKVWGHSGLKMALGGEEKKKKNPILFSQSRLRSLRAKFKKENTKGLRKLAKSKKNEHNRKKGMKPVRRIRSRTWPDSMEVGGNSNNMLLGE